MNLFEFRIDTVANVVLDQCKIFNCDIDVAWKHFMHPIITEQFTLEQVKEYLYKINNKVYPNNEDLAISFIDTVLKVKNINVAPEEKEIIVSLTMMLLAKVDKLKE